ncbi:MAG: murein biosynthesis integral membrane protein MurJ [Akkermansia sp.]
MMRSSLVASASIFLSRMTGMLREIVYTSLFGATGVTDAFNAAFRIPNLLRDLFAEGALSQAYTSVAAKTRKTDGDDALWELTNKMATQLSTLMIAIVTVGIIFAGPIMELLLQGGPDQSKMEFATDLSRIMWPFIGFASLSALVMGALNVVGVFGLPQMASAAFNIVSIVVGFAFGYYLDPTLGPKALYGFAIGVSAGGLAQWLVQVPRLKKAGFHWQFNFAWKDPKMYKIWGLMLPSVLASGVTQMNVFINTGFAFELQPGSLTVLTTAFKIWQLPVGLFGVATGMVVLPAISRMMVGDGRTEVAGHLAKALRFVAFFAVPSVVFLGILGEEIVSVIYQWGRFSQEAVIYTGSVLAAYSLGLLGYAGTKVVQPAFLALEKRWVPLVVSLIALIMSFAMNYSFVRIWHKDASWLALSTSIITTLNFLYYFVYLRKQLGGLCGRMLVSGLSRIIGAGIVLAGLCWTIKTYLMDGFLSWNYLDRISLMAGTGIAGIILYLGIAWLLHAPELDVLRERFIKKH